MRGRSLFEDRAIRFGITHMEVLCDRNALGIDFDRLLVQARRGEGQTVVEEALGKYGAIIVGMCLLECTCYFDGLGEGIAGCGKVRGEL